jgi:hypothetical protein
MDCRCCLQALDNHPAVHQAIKVSRDLGCYPNRCSGAGCCTHTIHSGPCCSSHQADAQLKLPRYRGTAVPQPELTECSQTPNRLLLIDRRQVRSMHILLRDTTTGQVYWDKCHVSFEESCGLRVLCCARNVASRAYV